MSPMTRLVPFCTLACGMAMSMPATAVMHTQFNYQNPAAACQLSIPTTDTPVRPRATGYRNESSSNSVFVICGFDKPTSDTMAIQLSLMFTSIDGQGRTISCTAVTGIAGFVPLTYSTKSTTSNIPGTFSFLNWASPDFSAPDDYIPYSYHPSVTCTLPPQTAITDVEIAYNFDVGS